MMMTTMFLIIAIGLVVAVLYSWAVRCYECRGMTESSLDEDSPFVIKWREPDEYEAQSIRVAEFPESKVKTGEPQ
jgi:hypothetical protein